MIVYKLEKAINELDITPNRLAVLAEVRPNTIGDLIKGNTKRIELETIEKILDALNYESARKNKRYFQIQDIIQYEIENSTELEYGSVLDKLSFELIRQSLAEITLSTNIPGHGRITVLNLLILNEEKFTNGIAIYPLFKLNEIDSALYSARYYLGNYYLTEIIQKESHNVYRLSEKGKEFIRLVKKYGTS